MRRTGTPAQPKFDYQLAWLKRLAALAGPLRERRPGRVGPLANVFRQGMLRAAWRARGSQRDREVVDRLRSLRGPGEASAT